MPLRSIADLNGPPDEITRRINQAKQLSVLYDTYVNTTQDGHEREPGIHASELYPCLRQPVYSLTNTPRKPQVRKFWKQRFKMGTKIHDMVQEDFERISKATVQNEAFRIATSMALQMNCRIEFQKEAKVRPELQPIAAYWKIYSACDGIFTFIDLDTNEVVLRVGLEIKSEAMDGYAALKAPKFEHMRQGHLYMGCYDLPLMWFFYMNKNNQNNTKSEAPFLVVFQPEIWQELEQRFVEIHTHAANNTLPDRTETVVCEFCAWNYTCEPKAEKIQAKQLVRGKNESLRPQGKV